MHKMLQRPLPSILPLTVQHTSIFTGSFSTKAEFCKEPMSLALLQGYSSAEEEQETIDNGTHYQDSSDDDGGEASVVAHPSLRNRSMFNLPQPSIACELPSAFDAFSEVFGPPEFLNNSVEEYNPAREVDQR